MKKCKASIKPKRKSSGRFWTLVTLFTPAFLGLVLVFSTIVKEQRKASLLRQAQERIDKTGGYQNITLSFLQSFVYKMPSDDQIARKDFGNQFPENIKALNNAKVSISGFMLPLYVGGNGKVRKFMIIGSQTTCCYGIYPPVNGWIEAEVDPKAPDMDMIRDIPIVVFGTLSIGEKVEDGHLTSVYQMKVERQISSYN